MSYNDFGTDFKYLIVNEQDRRFGSYVNTVGFQSIKANSAYPVKGHPSGYNFNVAKGRILREYQLIYISKGQGFFSSGDMIDRRVERGTIFLLSPGQWHSDHTYT